MQAAEPTSLKLIYEGSVKRVYASDFASGDRLWFEFTDDYSVFDWGKMPDTIAQKGRALTVMGAWFFETMAPPKLWRELPSSSHLKRFLNHPSMVNLFNGQIFKHLCTEGMNTHFDKLVDQAGWSVSLKDAPTWPQPVFMKVIKADVIRPTPVVVLGRNIFHYPNSSGLPSRRLVPLEVVFRFGMPSGSSLKERLQRDPEYGEQLGLKGVPSEGSWFDIPVIEFFTKLEPKDRLLTLTEALAISSLNAAQFRGLTEYAQLCALGLYHLLANRGIELWDGKFEFVIDGSTVRLADSVGPDELRLIYKGQHLSKEMIRQVYRGSEWEKSLKTAQKMAAERQSTDWKTICKDELKLEPAHLPASFKSDIVDKLYPTLANHLAGQRLFAGQPGLDDIVAKLTAQE